MSTEAGGQAVVRAQPVSFFLSPPHSLETPHILSTPSPPSSALLKPTADAATQFLWFPCGIIRGALASMGINATVGAETSELPGATFQIKSLNTPAKA
jgi:hypothetical protein